MSDTDIKNSELVSKRKEIKDVNPLSFSCVHNLSQLKQKEFTEFIIALWTYTSAGLEGNTLSFGETRAFIEYGITVKNKSFKEHNEIYGHAKAVEFLINVITKKENITHEDLFALHCIVQTEKIVDYYNPVGAYKRENNYANMYDEKLGKIIEHEYPQYYKIPSLMDEWLEKLNAQGKVNLETAVDIFTLFHTSFVSIHPFSDGNGRLSRLCGNIHLLKSGLPPLIIDKNKRVEYINLLYEFQAANPHNFYNKDCQEYRNIYRFMEQEWLTTLNFWNRKHF